jgi:N-acetylglucosaminyldiphosphoundecaprenol N-acetyl-beta-D-mannosaminyltransferase
MYFKNEEVFWFRTLGQNNEYSNPRQAMGHAGVTSWPIRYNVLGVEVSATTYEEATELLIDVAKHGGKAVVTPLPVHGITLASKDPLFGSKINTFDMVVPDGQPVRWALNMLYRTNLKDRVYGPELMLRLCRKASEYGIGIYLYGSYPHVVEKLHANLLRMMPHLRIVGFESPPFRPLTPDEDTAVVDRINRSGATLIFLGLGCPLQDIFAHEHRDRIKGVQVCVGAAFDFHAGTKRMAPAWMQRNGLEWLFRLTQEPTRLWRRYLFTNTMFTVKLALQYLRCRCRPK